MALGNPGAKKLTMPHEGRAFLKELTLSKFEQVLVVVFLHFDSLFYDN